MIDNKLYEYMAELLKRTPLDFIRSKYDEINWNGRLVGIVGPRGVGKSTMILQRIKLSKEGHHLYVLPCPFSPMIFRMAQFQHKLNTGAL